MKQETTDPTVMEALEWFVRMRDHKVSAADRDAFKAWLAADESHAVALRHAESLWTRIDIVQPEFKRLRRRQGVSRRNLMLGCLAVATGGAAFYSALGSDWFADLLTGAAERKTFTLADRSTVELGSDSALSVKFTEAAREVVLHHGEGFFDVAADRERPFIVRAAGGAIKALGTRFDVKYVDRIVTVAVDQHAVLVEVPSHPAVKIEIGWQVSYDRDGPGKPSRSDLETIEAWRRDRLMFRDVPLRRVLAELDRYRRGRIVLLNDRIGRIPVTAIFDAHQADNALATIADTLPVRVFHATDYLTLVSARH